MSWETVKLGSAYKISKGKKCTESEIPTSIRYIQIEDLRNDNNLKYCLEKEAHTICNPEDILIAWDGANAGTFGYGLKGAIGSTIAKLVVTKPNFFTPYVGHFLKSKSSYLRERCTGATIPHISKNELESLEIPLPPLTEQKRIAAILDQADELRQKDRQLLKHYDQLIQSTFLEMFGDPVSNPKNFNKKTFRKLSKVFIDGPFGSNLKTEHYTKEGVQVIRLNNINIGKFSNKDKSFISYEHYEKVLKKNTCLPGDVVIATLGEPNLRACIVPNDITLAVNKADVILCRPNLSYANPFYIVGLINNPGLLSLASHLSHGQTRIRISMGQLAHLEIPLPPINLQNQFAEIVTEIEKQKEIVQRQLESSEALFQSLLSKAFAGEV